MASEGIFLFAKRMFASHESYSDTASMNIYFYIKDETYPVRAGVVSSWMRVDEMFDVLKKKNPALDIGNIKSRKRKY